MSIVNRDALRDLGLLCAISGAVLFTFRATELSGMSASFASSANKGEWLLFSHHLLYQPVVNLFAMLLGSFGCNAVCAGQVHSILWAILAIASTYLITLHLTGSTIAAVMTGLLLLFSHGLWVFATQVEPYVPLVAMNSLIAATVILNGNAPLSASKTRLITAVFTFSLFFHQANLFFIVPLLVYLGLVQGRRGISTAIKIGTVAGALALSISLLAYWATHDDASIHGFRLWLTFYGVVSDDTHGAWRALLTLDPERLKQTGRSVVAAIVTTPSDALRTPVRIVVATLVAFVLVWNIVYAANRRSGFSARVLLLTWALTFLVFFSWWHAGVHKFFLTAVVPLLILSALTAKDLVDLFARSPIQRGLAFAASAAALSLIAAVNFDKSVRPMMGDGSGIMAVSRKLAAAEPGCVLYTKRRFAAHLNLYGLVGEFRTFQTMYVQHHFSRFNRDIGDSFRMSTDVSEDECNVILLDWLSFEDFQFKDSHRLGMRTAKDAKLSDDGRPNWPGFIAWLLNVRPLPDGSGVSYDELTFFKIQSGEAFVRIDRRKRAYAHSLDDILAALSEAVQRDPLNESTRQEHRHLNAFRNRVFGYS